MTIFYFRAKIRNFQYRPNYFFFSNQNDNMLLCVDDKNFSYWPLAISWSVLYSKAKS